jgi:hypothetical protein
MATIADVIERVYRDYLWPPDEQPARFAVGSGDIDATATTLPVLTTLLSPEEESLIGPGTLIEVVSVDTGGELMLIQAATGDPATSLTVVRQMYGTAGVAHSEFDFIYLAPGFPRSKVYDAVADAIESLFPRLWTTAVEETFISSSPVELPAECEEIIEVRFLSGNHWVKIEGWDLLTDYPLTSTEKAIQFTAANSGSIQVKYRAAPIRPSDDETETLDDLLVLDRWIKIITVGAAAQMVSGEDVSQATIDFITEALAAEGFPVGAGATLRNSLLQFQDFLIRPLENALEARNRTGIVYEELL